MFNKHGLGKTGDYLRVGENVQDQELNKQEAMIASLSRQLNTLKVWFTVLAMIVVFALTTFGRVYVDVFSFYESSLEKFHTLSLDIRDLNSVLEEQQEYFEGIFAESGQIPQQSEE